MIKTLAELKAKAIIVTDGMQTHFPQFQTTQTLSIKGLNPNAHIRTYAYNNSVVAFVDSEGTFYVIPDLKGTQNVLAENGYLRKYFYVPFSNWDYPVDLKKEWEKLWEEKNG